MEEIGLAISPSFLREEKAVGTITLDKTLLDTATIKKQENVIEKDFIKVRSTFYEFMAVGPNMLFLIQNHYSSGSPIM